MVKDRFIRALFYIGFFAITQGCSQPIAKPKKITGFPSEQKILLDTFLFVPHTDEYNNPYRILLYKSKILLCNGSGVKDYFFRVYDTSTKQLEASYIKGGRGPGEALSVLSNGILASENKLWAYDISAGKFFTLPLDSSCNSGACVHEMSFPYFYGMNLLKNGKILCTGTQDTSNTKLALLDISTKKVERQFGIYNDKPADVPIVAWKMAAKQAFLFCSPDDKYAALACRFTDQIEFFNLSNGQSIWIQGPEGFDPAFAVTKSQGKDIGYRNQRSRFAFVAGAATEKCLYLLYSGNLESGRDRWAGKTIFVFDWNGNPIKKISLDRNITCFNITPQDELLYAFDPNTQYLTRTNLK
jgi:hypothetical protein